MPSDAAAAAKEMILPGILKINEQFYIKVDDQAIGLSDDVTLLEEAVAYLCMYYYILNLNFPEPLKYVFGFFEKLFDISSSVQSMEVQRLHGFVTGKNGNV